MFWEQVWSALVSAGAGFVVGRTAAYIVAAVIANNGPGGN